LVYIVLTLSNKSSIPTIKRESTFFPNDLACGSLSTMDTSFVVKTLDFYLETADVFEVFLRGSDGQYGNIINCRLCGSYSEFIAQVILD